MASTRRHKVSKACWRIAGCKSRFIEQWKERGEIFAYTEEIASNPHYIWAVFEVAD